MSDLDPAFYGHLERLEDAADIELRDEEVDAIARYSLANGFSEAATEEAFAQIADAADEYEEPEQWQEEPEEYEEEREHDGDTAFQRDARAEVAALEKKHGRRFTQRELEAVVAGMVGQAERYDQISGEQALKNYHEQGGRKYDLANDQDRHAFMVERWKDERAAGDQLDIERQYDLNDDTQRQEYMARRLEGVEFEDVPAEEAA